MDSFDYDPLTGLRTMIETVDLDRGADITIYQEEDVEPALDICKAAANEGVTDHGIKSGFWHYCHIPDTVVMELKKKGIDITKKADHRKMFDEINANYPYLKVTAKTHAIQ